MTDSIIQYDTMVQTALLSVVKDVLKKTAQEGLPGDHHFYVTFKTSYPKVSIPAHLKKRYPEEMTIVIQNQYSDLIVDEAHFEISLSFNGKREHLYIPLLALEGFFDPSVDFGLHFHDADKDHNITENKPENLSEIVDATDEPKDHKADDNVVTLDTFRKK